MSEPGGFKEYIGDGVYADFDGFAIVLTTENGVSVQNTIVLEPLVIQALNSYLARIRALCAERRRKFDQTEGAS